jgi:endo-1,4-beta-D-glucanase Y
MKLILLFTLPCLTIAANLSIALQNTWSGLKSRNIDQYNIKCVHRPYSETPNDCVSEGIGYGMLVSLYSNDQDYFNLIWGSAEQYMWNGVGYDWRIDEYGNKMSYGSATDAEQDIALSLIFAQTKVDKGEWQGHYNPTYGERAQNILDNMWNSKMISEWKNLAPGSGWGGDTFVNPGYFAPAWYRIFHIFDNSNHDWYSVIDNCYNTILHNIGFSKGLIPDWTTTSGDFYYGDLGYNTYGNGQYLFKDAIRILWRISTDYLWNNETRAKLFLENSYNFIEEKGGAEAANFYTMNGDLVPENDIWYFDNGQKSRPRREHSHLTVGMWCTVPYVLNKSNTYCYENELMKFYPSTNFDYWVGDEFENEMYFDQFLAWFGGIILNGTFVC